MDYNKIYKNLITKASIDKRGHIRGIGYEIHHIQPRSMGGTNENSNLVKLTLREHFVAHRLLAKFTSGKDQMKMRQALVLMCGCEKYNVNSHIFEKVKQQRNESLRSLKVEAFGTPVTHFPLGYLVEHFRLDHLKPKTINEKFWVGRFKGTYCYSIHICKLGYEGITMGGSNGKYPMNKVLSNFIDLGFLKQPYKGSKGRVKIYDFTDKFKDISTSTKGYTWVHKIPVELATAPKGRSGVGIAKNAVTEWNKQNLRKMVKLIWSKNDPYIKKINAWVGDLPRLILN